MSKRITALSFILSLLFVSASQANSLICEATQKAACDIDEPCRELPTNIYILIDQNAGVYARCDSNSCDYYEATFSPSGPFTNIVFAPGTLAKLFNNGTFFTEVVTLGLQTLVSHGTCSDYFPEPAD